jgi:hypothetical protein
MNRLDMVLHTPTSKLILHVLSALPEGKGLKIGKTNRLFYLIVSAPLFNFWNPPSLPVNTL